MTNKKILSTIVVITALFFLCGFTDSAVINSEISICETAIKCAICLGIMLAGVLIGKLYEEEDNND